MSPRARSLPGSLSRCSPGAHRCPRADRDPRAFDLLGRVLVTYSGGAFSANLRWQHAAAQDEIWLMTPTGQTLAHIVDSADGATLTSADQQNLPGGQRGSAHATGPGMGAALSLLQYWVQGNPAPGFAPTALERGTARRDRRADAKWLARHHKLLPRRRAGRFGPPARFDGRRQRNPLRDRYLAQRERTVTAAKRFPGARQAESHAAGRRAAARWLSPAADRFPLHRLRR